MNNTTRFDGKGEIYAKARPSYATELFDYIKNTLKIPQGSVFADIGSGTGIFTEQLLDCVYRVYAVEPNADMRKKRRKSFPQTTTLPLLTVPTVIRSLLMKALILLLLHRHFTGLMPMLSRKNANVS